MELYTPENKHGTWKSPTFEEETSSSKAPFLGFHVSFRGSSYNNPTYNCTVTVVDSKFQFFLARTMPGQPTTLPPIVDPPQK